METVIAENTSNTMPISSILIDQPTSETSSTVRKAIGTLTSTAVTLAEALSPAQFTSSTGCPYEAMVV